MTLDLAGRIPTPAEVRDYASSGDADKKRKLVVRTPEGGHRGRGTEPGEAAGLYVDGSYVPTERRPSGRFWVRLLPHTEFDSLGELGAALIERHLV